MALTHREIILLEARLWLKCNSSSWAADEYWQSSWRCCNSGHDREHGWVCGSLKGKVLVLCKIAVCGGAGTCGRFMSVSAVN